MPTTPERREVLKKYVSEEQISECEKLQETDPDLKGLEVEQILIRKNYLSPKDAMEMMSITQSQVQKGAETAKMKTDVTINIGGPGTQDMVAGRYSIDSLLGIGGMAIVYKGFDTKDSKVVALKQLKSQNVSAEELHRFKREARMMQAISHDNIIKVYDIVEHAGTTYIILEYVDGITLEKWVDLRRAKRAVEAKIAGDPKESHIAPFTGKFDDPDTIEFLKMVSKICRAMAVVHAKNIIHRDIKPQNIFLTKDGKPKLGDFGLARDVSSGSMATLSGTVIGTPQYMAPEQARGKISEIDHRSDLFSIGCIMYQAFTGQFPFTGDSVFEILEQIVNTEPRDPREHNADVPGGLKLVIMTMLQKEKNLRYQDCDDIADDIDRFLAGKKVRAKPPSIVKRVSRAVKRSRRLQISIGVTAALLAAGIFLGLPLWQKIQREKLDEAVKGAIASADQSMKEGKHGDAVLTLQEAIKNYPESDQLHYTLACALAESGDLVGSNTSVLKAIQINPETRYLLKSVEISRKLKQQTGEQKYQTQYFEHAKLAYERDPSNADAVLAYISFLASKNNEQATKMFDALNENQKKSTLAQMLRGELYYAAGRLNDASDVFSRIRDDEKSPQSLRDEATLNHAICQMQSGKGNEKQAVNILTELSAGKNPYVPAVRQLALYFFNIARQSEFKNGIEDFRKWAGKYIEVAPNTDYAERFRENLAKLGPEKTQESHTTPVADTGPKNVKPDNSSSTAEAQPAVRPREHSAAEAMRYPFVGSPSLQGESAEGLDPQMTSLLSTRRYVEAEDYARELLAKQPADAYANWIIWRLMLRRARLSMGTDEYVRWVRDSADKYKLWKKNEKFDPSASDFYDPFPTSDGIWAQIQKF